MKTSVNIILLIVLFAASSKAENKYEQAMKDAMNTMNQAASVDDFQRAANQFDRIADATNDNWLPFYHSAYASVMMAAMEQDPAKKDTYLDAAQQNLDALDKLEHDATERMALEGFLIMIRMSVDPARGAELGQKCAMMVNQAYAMNNQNPRAVLMLAQFNHGSAKYMGGDTSEACAMFDTAMQLFDQPEVDKMEDFMPVWGKEMTMMMQQQCQE
jgi:hypothetical protein